MEKLKIICKKDMYILKESTILFESENHETVINWLITVLYDAQIKRCKCKITQYYNENDEFCKVQGTYTDIDNNKITYIISGLSNSWGNFINMRDTIIKNNIIIK